ncbi:MAG: DUF3237 domain-containing protein [Ilumatobacteraceae bacterium]
MQHPEHVPQLEFVAHVEVELASPMEFGGVLTGTRRVIPIIGGSIAGPLLNAQILDGGADWQIVAGDGTAIIDTRYTARTDDGSLIYLATSGYRHGPAEVLARVAAGEVVGRDEYYFRLIMQLESGGPGLEWLNNTVFVASAGRNAMSVVYDLFAVR